MKNIFRLSKLKGALIRQCSHGRSVESSIVQVLGNPSFNRTTSWICRHCELHT